MRKINPARCEFCHIQVFRKERKILFKVLELFVLYYYGSQGSLYLQNYLNLNFQNFLETLKNQNLTYALAFKCTYEIPRN